MPAGIARVVRSGCELATAATPRVTAICGIGECVQPEQLPTAGNRDEHTAATRDMEVMDFLDGYFLG
jgi:hypothetical protein